MEAGKVPMLPSLSGSVSHPMALPFSFHRPGSIFLLRPQSLNKTVADRVTWLLVHTSYLSLGVGGQLGNSEILSQNNSSSNKAFCPPPAQGHQPISS